MKLTLEVNLSQKLSPEDLREIEAECTESHCTTDEAAASLLKLGIETRRASKGAEVPAKKSLSTIQ